MSWQSDLDAPGPAAAVRLAAHVDAGAHVGYGAERRDTPPLQLGPDARIRTGTVIYAGSVIGARLQTGHNAVIREDNVLGNDVCVWSNSVIDYGCRIGDRVKIHTSCYVAQFSVLEDDAFLAPGVSFANDLYPGDRDSARRMRGPHIGAGAQIGVNATVLPYVRIGAGAIVGAGSVVTRDVPAGAVVYGSPARVAGRVQDLPPIAERLSGQETG